jgi:hypothetical protein
LGLFENMVESQISCGYSGCDCKNFFVDMENCSNSQYVDLICLKCDHIRQVSYRNYELMNNLENFLLYEAMKHRVEWNNESIKKIMMRYEIEEGMK